MADSVEEMTPLKQKLDEFGTFLSKVCPPPIFIACQKIDWSWLNAVAFIFDYSQPFS